MPPARPRPGPLRSMGAGERLPIPFSTWRGVRDGPLPVDALGGGKERFEGYCVMDGHGFDDPHSNRPSPPPTTSRGPREAVEVTSWLLTRPVPGFPPPPSVLVGHDIGVEARTTA